ncbi:MAG: toprim domain-containing protein, partial [Oscillospiraceae bacterium]|nr:toprim domain-containing protein [Oscillospiraceae bacterium]
MLSYLSHHHDRNWAKHSYVALCGTSSQPLLGMLERYPNIETVHLCLDNDQAGQLATRRLAKAVREKGLYVDARVPVLKDWNEDLCANFQQELEVQHEQSVS